MDKAPNITIPRNTAHRNVKLDMNPMTQLAGTGMFSTGKIDSFSGAHMVRGRPSVIVAMLTR